MRKVRNHKVSTNNPALMFAQGIESIISDPLVSPSQSDNLEMVELRRRATKQDSRGNLFNSLLRQFAISWLLLWPLICPWRCYEARAAPGGPFAFPPSLAVIPACAGMTPVRPPVPTPLAGSRPPALEP